MSARFFTIRRGPRSAVAEAGGTLTLKLGRANEKSFTLRHVDGHVFVYHPYEETPQLPVAATFAIGSDNRATWLTLDDLNDNGQERLGALEVKHWTSARGRGSS